LYQEVSRLQETSIFVIDEKTSQELIRNILNKFLLLKLVQITEGKYDYIRLGKLVFEIQTALQYKSNVNFSYSFAKFPYSPTSPELGSDVKFLIYKSMLKKSKEGCIGIADKGNEFLKGILIQKNTVEVIKEIFGRSKNLPLEVYLEKVIKDYGLEKCIPSSRVISSWNGETSIEPRDYENKHWEQLKL